MFRSLLHRSATAWLVLASSLAVTFVGWRVSVGYAEKRAVERFAFAADEAEQLIRKRMLEYEQVLRGGVGLFASQRQVTREEWRTYVEALQVQDYFPGIQGIGFARVLAPEDVPAFEARIQAQGFDTFAVWPTGDRDVLTSIEFLEPFDQRNQRAFGYDMFSHPVRRAAMARARDTGRPAMTSKVILLQETDTDVQPGVLTYLPVYDRSQRESELGDEPPLPLLGYVYAPFRMSDLMRGILDHTRREVDVRVYDGATPDGEFFLHSTTPDATDPVAFTPRYTDQRTIEISGQPWTLTFASNATFDAITASVQPTIIAVSGLVIDVLLFIIIATLGNFYRNEHQKALRYASVQTAMMESPGAILVATDTTGIISHFNPAAERALGYSADELIGQRTPQCFHDEAEILQQAESFGEELGVEVKPGFEVFTAKAIHGKPNTHEWTFMRKDGSRFPALLTVDVIRDPESHEITGFFGIATDISDRKETERRLDRSLRDIRMFNTALNSHAIVAITDVEGTITEVNDMFISISGYSRRELIGQNHRMINSGSHSREFFSRMWRTIANGQTWRGEIRNRAKDGTHYWVDTTIMPVLNRKGKPERYISIRTDITAHHRQTELLNDSQHLAAVGGWEYVVHTDKLTWTDEAYRIHDLSPDQPANLETKMAFYNEDGARRLRAAFAQARDQGTPFDLEILTAATPDRSARWLRVTGRGELLNGVPYRVFGSVQDIDEVKTAELSLAANEERFRSLAGLLPVGIWEVDEKGQCVYTNRSWQESAEMSFEESLDAGYLAAVHPEDRDKVLAVWEDPAARETAFEQEFRLLTKSGQVRWIHSVGTAVKREGRTIGYIGTDRDVTEHRRMVELLRQTQQLAAVGGWEFSVDTEEISWADETYRIHELDTSVAITVENAINFYHPDDRPRMRAAVEEAVANGTPWNMEMRIITGRGNERWVRGVGQAEFRDGRAARLYGTFQDIDASKRAELALAASEQRFRTVAEVAPIGIFETDLAGNNIFNNSRWLEITGLTFEDAMGRSWLEQVHPDDRTDVAQDWKHCADDSSDYEAEFRLLRPDGESRWVHTVVTPLLSETQCVGWVGSIEDVTERRASMTQLASNLEEKEVLLREVHHRVKNNLQLVTSLLNLQAGYLTDPTVLSVFEDSQRRVRAMALVHEMLYAHTSLARIEIDLYLRQLAQTILRSFSDATHRIKFEPDLAPLALLPDIAIPLGIIVNELLTNACKHGRSADHVLELRLELTKIEPDGIALHFSDNGPGMPADFDPATSKSLGFRLINLLTKQLRASLETPVANGPATYKLRLQTETQNHGS